MSQTFCIPKPRIARCVCLACAAGLFLLPNGCLSPRKKVAARLPGLRAQWITNVVHQAAPPEQTVDWPAAVALLRAHNLKLLSSPFDISNNQESVRQVYKDLIPTV